MPAPMVSHDQKVIYPISIILTQGMQWCHWQYCCHHMLPTLVPMVSMTKKVMLNIIDLRKAMVPLMTSASHDSDSNTNGIAWPKKYCFTSFQLSKGMQWCHWQHYWHHMIPRLVPEVSHDQNQSCCTSFWTSWHKEYIGAIDDAVHITRCWHQHNGITWH